MNQNFTGCIENLFFDNTNFIRDLEEAENRGEDLRYNRVNAAKSCPENHIIPVTFLTHEAVALFNSVPSEPYLNASLAFRSYKERGMILYQKFQHQGFVKVKYVCNNFF